MRKTFAEDDGGQRMVDKERPCHVGEPDNRKERRADDCAKEAPSKIWLLSSVATAAAMNGWLYK